MRHSVPLLLLLLCAQTITACSDKLDLLKVKGTYTGIFRTNSGGTDSLRTGPVTVSLTENSYRSSGNRDYVPAGGSGTFELRENNYIHFVDQNAWTANFDWNLILNGAYQYKLKGDSLIMKKSFPQGTTIYEYRLKRTQ